MRSKALCSKCFTLSHGGVTLSHVVRVGLETRKLFVLQCHRGLSRAWRYGRCLLNLGWKQSDDTHWLGSLVIVSTWIPFFDRPKKFIISFTLTNLHEFS